MGSFLFYTIIFITISVPVGIVIFDFFDIKFEVYGNYLLWFIAMALFNAILPYKQISIFDDDIISKVKKSISNITTPAWASALPVGVAVFEQNNPEGKTISDSGMNLKTTTAALPRNVSTTTTNTTNTNKNDAFSNLTPTKSKNNIYKRNRRQRMIFNSLFGSTGLFSKILF